MNRAKFTYELLVTGCATLGSVVGSSTFAYESRHQGAIPMIAAASCGGTIGFLGGFFVGVTLPVAIPGLLLATAFSRSETGSKKLIEKGNAFLAGKIQNGIQSAAVNSPPPGSPSAPVSI